MDESVAVVLRNSFSNPLCTLDVYIFVREVLCRVVAADEVENNVRMPYALLNRLRVPQVVFNKDDFAQITSNLEMALGHLLTVGNNDGASRSRESVDNVSSQEAGCTEDSNSVTSNR